MDTKASQKKHHRDSEATVTGSYERYERRSSDAELDRVTGSPDAYFDQARQTRRASQMAEMTIKLLESKEDKKEEGKRTVLIFFFFS
ncbi:hypothetical protein IscW_ISCW005379 [Ixodes scapularis]|uniref:Uncharacterized protein n=1 Tax=Ixodes scapularis TaxID=6945 RepID=B7PQY7_IXOSC|nr:hypothetical protein IscW_ISCW005379 [Ixodes scapularis]|eukprot:XP_002436179.1 hypothetical protein IscW_ISCW005379 [Ixodes scapularis]